MKTLSLFISPAAICVCVAVLLLFDWRVIPPLFALSLCGAVFAVLWNAFGGYREVQAGHDTPFVRYAVHLPCIVVFPFVVGLNALLRHS